MSQEEKLVEIISALEEAASSGDLRLETFQALVPKTLELLSIDQEICEYFDMSQFSLLKWKQGLGAIAPILRTHVYLYLKVKAERDLMRLEGINV